MIDCYESPPKSYLDVPDPIAPNVCSLSPEERDGITGGSLYGNPFLNPGLEGVMPVDPYSLRLKPAIWCVPGEIDLCRQSRSAEQTLYAGNDIFLTIPDTPETAHFYYRQFVLSRQNLLARYGYLYRGGDFVEKSMNKEVTPIDTLGFWVSEDGSSFEIVLMIDGELFSAFASSSNENYGEVQTKTRGSKSFFDTSGVLHKLNIIGLAPIQIEEGEHLEGLMTL
jgi:hypothetical protein